MGLCQDPSEVLHEAVLGQDALTCFAQSHTSELPSCLKAGLKLTGIYAAPPEIQNGLEELSSDETAGCVSYDFKGRVAANLAGPILEKVSGDEGQIGIGNFCLKKEGLCMENAGEQGKDGLVISVETHEMSATHLKRNCVQAKEQRDDNGVNGPSSKGLVEPQGGSLAVMESNTRDHVSAYCEMPVELQSVAGPSHCHEQDCQEDDKLVSCTFTKRILKVIEEEHDALVGTETLSCNQSVPPEGCEISSESMFDSYSPKQHIQLDDLRRTHCIGSPYVEGFIRVSEKGSGVLVGADSLSCKPLLPSEGAEVSTTCLATKSIQQGEQKDDKCIDCPFAEAVMEVKEVMSFSDQILPSHVCEILSESMPVTILSKSCDEENVPDIRTFHALDRKIDRSYQIEAHSCNQISHPEGDEMPIKSLAGDLESSGCHDNQKSETGDSDPYPERSTKGVETKNSAETCVYILSPQYVKSDGKHVSDLSAESNLELLEEKNDSKSIRVEHCSELSSIEQNAFNSRKGLSGMAANVLLERPTSLQLTGCSDVFEHSSFASLDVTDCLRRSVFGSIDSVSAVESFGPEDNKEINIVKVDQVSEIKISENVSLSYPRSNRTRKSSQKSNGKKAARKHRDAAKVPHLHKILEHILKSPKRKRSHFSRSARCALWGSMGNITQLCKQSNGLDYVLNQESLKSLGGREKRKRNKSGKGGSSGRTSRKLSASTSVLRLKVKVGRENCQRNLKSVISEVLDTSASAGLSINNSKSDYCPGGGLEPSKSANGTEAEWGEEVAEKQLFSVDKCLEDVKTELDVDFHGGNSDCTLVPGKLDGDGANIGLACHMMVEALGGTIERTYADPGTSPDSEVTNIVPDAEVVAKQEEWNGSYGGAVARNRKGILPCVGADIVKTAKPLQKGGGKQKLGENLSPTESLASSTIGTASSISSGSRDLELLSLPIETELEVPGENLEVKIVVKDEKCCDLDGHLGLSESENSQNMVYSTNSERVQPTKTSKPEGLSKERSKVSDLVKGRKVSASSKRGSKQKSVSKAKVKEKRACDHTANRVDGYPESGKHIAEAIGSNNVVSISNLDMASGVVIEQGLHTESAWVSCDDCHKWRRISDALVNSIDDSSPWSCKDNMDKAFADCTIPQEKSNADINAELGISYADEDVYDNLLNMNGSEYKHMPTVSQESSFKRIDSNEFLHRSRKNQTIDEIMVCHCKPPQDGCLGCGDQCLNRMLNIECLQGTCPCGDICSNQQFQKRQYAGMKWVRCGKKGFGLQLQQDISKGRFLIEYVGEVLDMHAYEARQREYAAKGHKHFYFMTLNGSEVIDASAKGNLGRFINHSCDPNCRTEKWVVNGEICIGLFALRDIKKGEEVTFDYNYVRVFGAAVKKCYCGSSQCRGYIGGDPHNSEVIVQGDSDEEFPEPVMLEDGKTRVHKDRSRRINSFVNEDMKSVEIPVLKSEMTTEIGDAINLSVSIASQPHSSLDLEASKRKSSCSSQPIEVSPQTVSASKSTSLVREPNTPENTSCSAQVLEKSFSVDADESRKSQSETVKGKRVFSKSRFLIKNAHLCGSLKKGKVNGNLVNENKVQMIANKPQVPSVRPKKLVEASSDSRFEAVEEKLNELLDANGGISKRKEAPKGYLKLLLLTAASGGTGNGEAIQSNRDLSMILDALLKTKSRVVLVDIINKNGLRMLHNIMKQYQRDFKKIPILRKLLKVLEYLATREILAFDHINGGPPCPGMESFRESMLSLTEHDDKQVHRIARHFRDRWITKFVRKANCLDRDDRGMEFHRGSSCGRVSVSRNHWRDDAVKSTKAIDCVMQSVPVTTSVDGTVQDDSSAPSAGGFKTNGANTRKRKSRWDQPAESKTNMRSSISPNVGEVDHLEEVSREDSSCLEIEYIQSQCQQNKVICAANGVTNSPEDVPPGFSSPLKNTLVSSSTSITQQSVGGLNCPLEVVVGQSQGKFISRLPVSYGIPLPIMQQIGSPDNETLESWVIAPGMPFRPFPPLPPYPHDRKSTAHCAVKTTKEQAQVQDNLDNTGGHPHENNHSRSFAPQSEVNFQVANVQQACKRARGSSYDLGKNYYRQQKWNKVPPWLRRSMECGYANPTVSNNLRGGTCSIDVGNMTNEFRSPYCTQNVDHGVEKAASYYNSHPHHHNQH